MRISMSLKEAAPQVIPAGTYICECTEVREIRAVETSRGPSEVLDVKWKIIEGTSPEAANRTFQDSFWLDEKSLWRVALLFQQVLGLKKEEIPELQSTEEIQEYMQNNLPGSRAAIVLEVVTHNETERNRVKRITGVK